MQNRRLLFTVIIKVLSFSALLLLVVVFVNSLFTNEGGESQTTKKELPLVSLDIAEIRLGEVKKIRWTGKEVAVLSRQFSDKLKKPLESALIEKMHPSIDPHIRSKNIDYFVYYNIGDSKNCPLFYAAGIFKDVCSLNKFDEAGRNINANPQSFQLQIPPHYFDKTTVIFGKWEP